MRAAWALMVAADGMAPCSDPGDGGRRAGCGILRSMSNKPELLLKPQAARELNICVRSLENLMKARALSFLKIGKSVRIPRASLEEFKQRHTVKAVI